MAIKGIRPGVRGRGSFNVEVKLEGQITKFRYLTNHANILLASSAIAAQRGFAYEYKEKVIENIKNGGKRFGYPPHSPKYASWKSRKGGPSSLLFWSGAMANAVEVRTTNNKSGYVVGIQKGVSRGKYHSTDNNRLTISEYANVLEHGAYSRGIPARPVFSDTFKEHMGGLKGLKNYLELNLISSFAKKGIIINKL